MIFFTKGRDTREGNDIEYDKSEKCAINTLNKKKERRKKVKQMENSTPVDPI